MSDKGQKDQTPKRISLDKVLTEPEMPLDILAGPPIAPGTNTDWVLERPPLFLSARILPDDEAKKIHWTIHPNRGDIEFKETMDYEFTIIELLIENRSDTPFRTNRPGDYRLKVSKFDDPSKRIDSSNYSAHSSSKNWLGKDNVLTKALDLDIKELTIPPWKSFKWLNYFTKWAKTKDPLPEMMFRSYAGRYAMWPTRQRTPPPGVKAPVEGVVKFYLYRPDRNDQGYQEPEDVTLDEGRRLEAMNEWGETVEFLTEHPLEVPASQDTAFARIIAVKPGDSGIVGPGVINKFSRCREIAAVTNTIPTWDSRGPPPELPAKVGALRRMWLATTDIQRPLVAAHGDLFAIAVENHLWVFDARGELKHNFDTSWYPYSLCFGKGGKTICMGHDNVLVEFDLERNRSYDLQELPYHIDNLALGHDGTIIAVGGDGLLMPVDAEGRVLKTFHIGAKERVFCASCADVILVWNGYGFFQIVNGGGKEIASKKVQSDNYDGLAISPDGKMLAAGEYGDKVSILDIDDDLSVKASYPTIGLPHTLCFHPTMPILFVATRNSYLHVFHLDQGPLFTKRLEGWVANDMAFGANACILSMVNGYIHNLKLDDDKGA